MESFTGLVALGEIFYASHLVFTSGNIWMIPNLVFNKAIPCFYPILKDVQERWPGLALNAWYLDDGTIFGEASMVSEVGICKIGSHFKSLNYGVRKERVKGNL